MKVNTLRLGIGIGLVISLFFVAKEHIEMVIMMCAAGIIIAMSFEDKK